MPTRNRVSPEYTFFTLAVISIFCQNFINLTAVDFGLSEFFIRQILDFLTVV